MTDDIRTDLSPRVKTFGGRVLRAALKLGGDAKVSQSDAEAIAADMGPKRALRQYRSALNWYRGHSSVAIFRIRMESERSLSLRLLQKLAYKSAWPGRARIASVLYRIGSWLSVRSSSWRVYRATKRAQRTIARQRQEIERELSAMGNDLERFERRASALHETVAVLVAVWRQESSGLESTARLQLKSDLVDAFRQEAAPHDIK